MFKVISVVESFHQQLFCCWADAENCYSEINLTVNYHAIVDLGVQKRKTPEHHYLNFKLCVLNWRNVIFIVQVSSYKSKIAWLGHFSKILNEKRLTKKYLFWCLKLIIYTCQKILGRRQMK